MITTGARLWLAIVGFALAAAVAWQAFSGGEEQGLFVLLGVASGALVLGVVAVLLRDGEVVSAEDAGERTAATEPPGVTTGAGPLPAPWPALGALGVAVTCVGLATGGALLYVGLGLVAVVVIEWMVQGWAERATPDRDENLTLRNRLMFPFEIPALGLLIVGLVLLAFSRVLLALPSNGSTVVAIVVATLILAAGALVAARPRITTGLVTAVLVLGAVGLLGGGVVGAIAGEREFEEEGEEEEVEEPGGIEETVEEEAADSGSDEVTAEGGEITLTAGNSTTAFDQQRLVVPAGEPVTLTFVNESDSLQHGVTVGDETTGPVAPGNEGTVELELEAGEYDYVNIAYPAMRGTLVAEGEAGSGEGESSEVEGEEGETQTTSGEQSENPDGGSPDGTTEVSNP